MLTPGSRIGHYEITASLGSGGMGHVYRARDSRLGRDVAVKVLRDDIASDRDRVKRFEREARSASALNHPNIVTIHDIGWHGDVPYIAMEWVAGDSLRAILSRERLPARRLLDVAVQTGDGLSSAHAAGIVHRDLKPENMMVTSEGRVKILDFGLAKLAPRETEADSQLPTVDVQTRSGIIVGTVGYMSPEQASGRPLDHRSDQFALGLILYEMMAGKRAFARDTAAQTLAAIIEAEAEPIDDIDPELPPELPRIVTRCLSKDPAGRYDSTRDLARDLETARDAWTRGASASASVSGSRAQAPKHTRIATGAAFLVGLALVIGGAAYWFGGSGSPEGETQATETEADPVSENPVVAVLPFTNISAGPGQDYFASGMTEEIRGQLSKLSGLRLLSRSAVERYRDGDLRPIVDELGAGSVVEGSVRVDANRVRISVELIDARSEQTLWSEQYDREVDDVFDVQSEVAVQIAQTLQATLSPEERGRVEKRPTDNVEAYQIYLRSLELSVLERAQNLEGIELLKQAVALDPDFTLARARMAYRYFFLGYYGDRQNRDIGLRIAEDVVRDDPELAYGHYALASLLFDKGLTAQSRLSFLRALELDPSDSSSMSNLSIAEVLVGRFDESLYWARRAFQLVPNSGNSFYHVGVPLIALRDDEATERWLAEGERRFPDEPRIQLLLAMLAFVRGDGEAAVRRSERLVSAFPDNEEARALRGELALLTGSREASRLVEPLYRDAPDLGAASGLVMESRRTSYARLLAERGDTDEAERLLEESLAKARQELADGNELPSVAVEIAAIHAVRNMPEEALDWLGRAHEAGYRDYGVLQRDPFFAAFRDRSDFQSIVERMERDVADMRARARERGLYDFAALTSAPGTW